MLQGMPCSLSHCKLARQPFVAAALLHLLCSMMPGSSSKNQFLGGPAPLG